MTNRQQLVLFMPAYFDVCRFTVFCCVQQFAEQYIRLISTNVKLEMV